MDNDSKVGIIVILIIVIAFFFLSSNYQKKSDIRELMEDKLVDHFSTVSGYLEGYEDISRKEAQDSFNIIEQELNKLY